MRAAVEAAFRSFTVPFEGQLPYMYLDVKGLVTTGIGNLIDPLPAALGLPWKKADGSLASQSEITAEWNYVKSRTDLDQKGGKAYGPITTLRLDNDAIDQLVVSRLHQNEALLRKYYPNYDSWPADAQMGIHSMSWAMGPAFNFPQFKAAVNKSPPDFNTAAVQSHINTAGNAGVAPRNTANLLLFQNAAKVVAGGGDPDKLWYPDAAPADGGPSAPGGGMGKWVAIGGIALILLGGGLYLTGRLHQAGIGSGGGE